MRTLILFGLMAAVSAPGEAATAKKLVVTVQREKTADGLVTGKLLIDGKEAGAVYENDEKKIPAGTYKGVVRTTSGKNFVQGPGGKLGKSGDFLLEIGGVPGRTDILLHPGNKKEHSLGCVLGGPAGKDPKSGDPVAPEALRKLRLAFFGTDTPTSSPNTEIEVVVTDKK
jgi:hypothetical protein